MIIKSYEKLFCEIKKIYKKKNKINIMLTGGESIIDFYKFLNKKNYRNFFIKGNFYLTDERLFEIEKNTNYFKIKKVLFKGPSNKNIKFNKFFDNKKSVINNLDYYEKKLEVMDIIFLSHAKDGHIASLFPNLKPNISKKKVCYVINKENKFKHRISVTRPFIIKSKNKFLFFIGDEKQSIYKKITEKKTKENLFVKKFNIVLV